MKYKIVTLINVTGLAIGISCSILIFLFVRYELSYDKFYDKADRIYRVAVRASIGNTKINQTYSSAITFQKLLEDFAEFENGVRLYQNPVTRVDVGEKKFYEKRVISGDSTFFDVFSFPMLKGNPHTALANPNSVVISKSTALKYFNTFDVVGKTFQMDFSDFEGNIKSECLVTGVVEDIPANTHFHFDILVSLMSFPEMINNTGWTNNNYQSYLVVKEGTDVKGLVPKLKEFTRKYMGEEDFDKWVAKGNSWEYYLQPVTDIHLRSSLNGEFEANGNGAYVNVFFGASILILVVAILNFVNLSTARSSLRGKEVGIKKVIGSSRGELIAQFINESIITSVIAMVIATVAVQALLPVYSNFVGRPLELNYFNNFYTIPALLLVALGVGLMAGLYPALVLSSFKPVSILKNYNSGRENAWLRNVLVVFQLVISIFLIISTVVITQQLEFLLNKDLGFDKQQVLVVNNPGLLVENVDAFKTEINKQANIMDVSGSNFLPGKGFSNIGFGAKGIEGFTLNIGVCDYAYAKTLKLEIKEGRFFSPEFPSDSNAVVINEKAAEILGGDDILGKNIHNWSREMGTFNVIGVVKDFNYESMHQSIRPMALFLDGGYYKRIEKNIVIRLNTGNIGNTIDQIENTWQAFTPGSPFEFSFLDEDYNKLYVSESQTRKVITIFSILSIFVACLGLLGLASFIAERRTKEIAIRKILGASLMGVINMQNKGFVIWVLVASLIAWPLSWFAMNNWLQDFAYKIQLTAFAFILSTAIVLTIALIVASSQTIKSAIKNPVDSLHTE